jgi:ArsR family transcriptional regulator, nickel/cobalt-responsive transcriptional repressor
MRRWRQTAAAMARRVESRCVDDALHHDWHIAIETDSIESCGTDRNASPMINAKKAKQHAKILSAVAEPCRIRIIDALRSGPKNVTELATLMRVEIVNISHHLQVLKDAGLLQDEKVGRFVIYTLNPKHFSSDGTKYTSVELGWCRIEIPHS